MSLLQNSNAIESGGYNLERSLRFRSSASAYLSRTPASAGNRQKWTWSGWLKRGSIAQGSLFSFGGSASTYGSITIDGSTNQIYLYDLQSNSQVCYVQTNAVYRDPSAWYHLVVSIDTTQATAANRVVFYVNGVQVTSYSQTSYPTQNSNTGINSTNVHGICAVSTGSFTSFFDGYLAEVNFIDGQALTPTSFGEFDTTTGVWKPKKYAGTYGTNGFYLNFNDNSAATAAAIGKDSSGNGNNWTPNNISLTAGVTYDSMTDVPTLTSASAANYCVLNPLDWVQTSFSLTNGNLTWTSTTTAGGSSRGTVGMTTGKWYWEVLATSVGSGSCGVGIAKDGSTNYGSGQVLYAANTGDKYIDGTNTTYGATWTTNNVIGIAYDADAGQITFYKDNVSQGTITLTGYAGINVCPVVSDGSSLAFTLNANFGQRPFAYTPPSGFKALNTFNLPDSTIVKGSQYFDVTTYTGTGANQSIVNSGAMQPDLIWFKSRSSTAYHAIFDSVRGRAYGLSSNATDIEQVSVNAGDNLVSFNSNGFTVGSVSTGPFWNSTNGNALSLVGWQWKESALAGFDIVTYTGNGVNRTIAHSLGVAPSFVIVKSRSAVGNWAVWHTGFTSGAYYMQLDSGFGNQTLDATYWNSTVPTSSAISVGTNANTNANGVNYVAYCFANIDGFSKAGKYTGNGNTDGPFIHLGFRPKLIIFKRLGDQFWTMLDSSVQGYNVVNKYVYPGFNNAEFGNTDSQVDFLSNGFKHRNAAASYNFSAAEYIYIAFAENPFKNSLAR